MRHLDTMQQGGYPFDDISIDYLQKMHNDRDAFLFAVFGDKRIVSGCITSPETSIVSDGLITHNGKLYHFVGGAAHAQISLIKVETSRNYEDGNQKKAFINEFFEFGTNGTDIMPFTNLKRWYKTEPIIGEIKEIAGNISNSALPAGWFIADGTNGTNDLRSKFIVGFDPRDSDYDNVGSTGGSKMHQLSINEMPTHKHGMEDGGDKDTGYNGYIAATDGNGLKTLNNAFTKEKGGNQPHENRPPFYVAVRIQFVGI